MKAVVNTKALKRAVKSAVSVLVKKPSHSEFEAIVLKTVGGMLYVGVMGDDIMVISSLRAAGAENGSVATRAKAFYDLLKNESSSTVTLDTVDNNLRVRANLVDHSFYAMYVDSTILKILNRFDSTPIDTLTGEQISQMSSIADAACMDGSSRPVLRNVHMSHTGQQRTIEAADGFRIHSVKTASIATQYDMLFSADAVGTLNRLFAKSDMVLVSVMPAWNNYVLFSDAVNSVLVRVVPKYDALYPNTARVFIEDAKPFVVGVDQMLEAVDHIESMVGRKVGAVAFEFSADTLKLTSDTVKQLDMEESRRVTFTLPIWNGFSGVVKRFNVKYIKDALKCFSGAGKVNVAVHKTTMELSASAGDDQIRCVVMGLTN